MAVANERISEVNTGMGNSQLLVDHVGPEVIEQLALPSNIQYGKAILSRGGVEFVQREDSVAEAMVGGLHGDVAQGAGQRRRTTLNLGPDGALVWHCACNSKSRQIFCKHCVALALALQAKENDH